MKLAKQIIEDLFTISPDAIKDEFENLFSKFEFEGIEVDDVEVGFDGDIVVTFEDDMDAEMSILFTWDEEEGAIAVPLDDEFDVVDQDDDGDVDFIDLDALEPPLISMGDSKYIDLTDLSWLNATSLEVILTTGLFYPDEEEVEMEEAMTTVIRGGKKVRLPVVRRVRKKRLTPKQKAGIKKATRKRKAKSGQISRKRKKSLALRKRSNVKSNTRKGYRVQG